RFLADEGLLAIDEEGRVSIPRLRFGNFLYGRYPEEHHALHARIAAAFDSLPSPQSVEDMRESAHQHFQGRHREAAQELYKTLAEIAHETGAAAESANYLNKALDCASEPSEKIALLRKLGDRYLAASMFRESVSPLLELLPMILEDGALCSHVNKSLGKAYLELGEGQLAIKHFEDALALAPSGKDSFGILQEIISIRMTEGRYDEALAGSRQQKKIAEKMNDPRLVALVETDIGIAHFYLGKFDESLAAFTSAHTAYVALDDKKKTVDALINIGNTLSEMRQTREALRRWQEALSILGDSGSRQQRAQILNNIGIAHCNLREFEEAKSDFEESQAIFTETGSKSGIALTLTNMGEVHFALGEYGMAHSSWAEAMEYYNEMQNLSGRVQTLLQSAELEIVIGRLQAAEQKLSEAERLMDEGNLITFRGFLRYLNARASECAGLDERMHVLGAESAEIYKMEGQFIGGGDSLADKIGRLDLMEARFELRRGKSAEAQSVLGRLLSKSAQFNNPAIIAETRYILGNLSLTVESADRGAAFRLYRDALSDLQNEPVTEVSWQICLALAGEFLRRGNVSKAQEQIRSANALLEFLASKCLSEELKTAYLSHRSREDALRQIEHFFAEERSSA
ncbi:MAG TPA: tetratricopeptide repeat protein, partial [Bacteroidota bacterium]|nr:tetratricopeptide repeat protein [Bacteroidota bacterium]